MIFARPAQGLTILCADLDRVGAYYENVLGLASEADRTLPGGVRRRALRAGAHSLHLVSLADTPPAVERGVYDALGIRVLALLLADLDHVLARIEASGRKLARADNLPGQRPVTFARDPEGNTLELIGPLQTGETPQLQLGLTVSDAARSRAFYGDVLGLPEEKPAPITSKVTRYGFLAGETTIKLWQPRMACPNRAGPPADALGLRAIRLSVADLAEPRQALQAASAPVLTSPVWLRSETDAPSLISRDPDGNALVFEQAETSSDSS